MGFWEASQGLMGGTEKEKKEEEEKEKFPHM